MMCAKCLSSAISCSVILTMPRSRLNSAGTCLLAFGSSIDSMMNVTTICFCSRVMPRSSDVYGAIGVSLIFCAIAVIILTFRGSVCKDTNKGVKCKIIAVFFVILKIFAIFATSSVSPFVGGGRSYSIGKTFSNVCRCEL